MIRDCVNAYKALIETVSGIGTVIPYARIVSNQGETKTIYGDNVVMLNYSSIRKIIDERSNAIFNPITLNVRIYKAFVDSGSYSGSTQEAFDTLLDALLVAFDEDEQRYTYSGSAYSIGDIKEIRLVGDSGIGDWALNGKTYHGAEFQQEVWLIE